MKELLKGVIFSVLLTIILIGVLSILISTTSLSENIINPTIIGINSFSIMIGGFIVSKSKKEKGIINGGILGIVYILILYVISSLITLNFSITFNSVIMIMMSILGGMVGGIIGVNF